MSIGWNGPEASRPVDIDSQGHLHARSACTRGFAQTVFTLRFLALTVRSPLNLLEQVGPELLGFQSLLSTAISLVVPNWHAWAQWLRRVSFLTASVFAKRKNQSESMFLPDSRFKS